MADKLIVSKQRLSTLSPAAGERSFSTSWRLKHGSVHLTFLNIHKGRTDRLSTIDITNEFFDRNTNRKRNFMALFKDMIYSNFNIIHLIIFSYRFVKFQSRGNILNE